MISASPHNLPAPKAPSNALLSQLRWLILLIFPIGWQACHEFFALDTAAQQQFSQLTVIAFLLSGVILYHLRSALAQEIHLWITFVLILVGHYIKLYLVLYWKLTGDGSITAFPRSTIGWITDPALLIQAHEIAAYGLLGLAIAVWFVQRSQTSRSAAYQAYLSVFRERATRSRLNGVKRNYLVLSLAILMVVSFALLYFYADLEVNAYFSASGFGRTVLKNNLAGILTYSTKLLVPALFIVVIYIADTLRASLTFQIGVGGYLLYSAILGFFSTSKGPILMAVMSLLIVWVFASKLTPQRLAFLTLAFLLMPVLFGLVMNLRSLREFGEIGKLSNLGIAYQMLQNGSDVQRYQFTYISRIMGYNTLPEIINYDPAANLGAIYSFLMDNGFHIGDLFKTEVRQYSAAVAVGFSPGLVGCFYLLSGSAPVVAACMCLYTIFWDRIFKFTSNLPYVTQPMAVAQVCLLSAHNTSEGTLYKLPLQLLIIGVIIFVGEMVVREFVRSR